MQQSPIFQILSLSGGGYRGLYTAQVLADLEEEAGKPIGRCFDLIAGTSVGGIIALAVSYEVPMKQVVELFEFKGEQIFKKKNILKTLFKIRTAPYSSDGLKESLVEVFGDKTLADLKHPIIVPSINYTSGSPQVFKTPHEERLKRDYKYKIVDIALAASAAPTYFKRHIIDNQQYVDGGLCANDPSLLAIHEAECYFKKQVSQIYLMDIGTLSSKRTVNPSTNKKGGYYDWAESWDLTKAAPNIIDISLSNQQQLMKQMTEHRLQKEGGKFVRIDENLGQASAQYIGLDQVNQEAIEVLKGNAKQSSKIAIGKELVTEMLKYQASPPTWFNGPNANNNSTINENN